MLAAKVRVSLLELTICPHFVSIPAAGAPLVPVYHQALTRSLPKPLALFNVGGVANITYIAEDDDGLLGFDTGPGNALIDDWMLRHTGKPIDPDGATALRGVVQEDVLAPMLQHVYFDRAPPKSLDRNDFAGCSVHGLSLEDGAATLTALTARSVALAMRHLPLPPLALYVCGGGRHNAALMQMLQDSLGLHIQVSTVEVIGLDGDALEAEAFAFLASRTLAALPISFPGTTGAPHALCGGTVHRP